MNTRPDLSSLKPEVRKYIESLEAEIEVLKDLIGKNEQDQEQQEKKDIQVSEPPTTIQIITMTAGACAKRTPRHLYSRQRRGGMGVFDMDPPSGDPPELLISVDENLHLILFTNLGRAFRIPVKQIEQTEIRARGRSLIEKLTLQPGELLTSALPDQARGVCALVTAEGYVRTLRHHVFGEYMRPGTVVLDAQKFGELRAACWTSGSDDLFIATLYGKAIRFPEKVLHPQGGQGIRLEANDVAIGITSVTDDTPVFLADAQGNGSIRLMAGFSANKSAGGGGKIAMKTDNLACVFAVNPAADIFLLSGLSKVIRFAANEVPQKEDPVQGVRCMELRADEVITGIHT